MTLLVNEVARLLDIPENPDWEGKGFHGCSLDSQNIARGNLFACLKGARADGHDFAMKAQAEGAGAILASRSLPELAIPVLVVPDVVKALGKTAHYWRKKTSAKVIAITGTAGKTTLKDMLVPILSCSGKTAGSRKNNNNQIGLPVSMLNMDGDEKFWVLEAGISHAGDMDELGAIIEPDLALIINAGAGHTEGLAGEGVAKNKAKLFKYLRKDGIALVNGDYPELLRESRFCKDRRLVFSTIQEADYYLSDNKWLQGRYTLAHAGGAIPLETPFRGVHFGELCGMAAACAHLCGLDPSAINKGFAKAQLPEQRFRLFSNHGWLVFDDTYNANPLSMRAMLQSAAILAKNSGRKLYAVLGEMKELGRETGSEHRELGSLLASLNIAVIFWIGDNFDEIRSGYNAGKGKNPLLRVEDPRSFAELAKSYYDEKEAIIFKGSRSNRLENYLSAFSKLLEASG